MSYKLENMKKLLCLEVRNGIASIAEIFQEGEIE